VVAPDALTGVQETMGGPNYRVGLTAGAVQVGHTLPVYNPTVAPLALQYRSTAADARPVFAERFTLDPSRPVPPTVSARLTFNGLQGAAVYYDTSLLNPGDILQVALQGDATSLATGRYGWQIDVTANYGTPVTTTLTGSVNVINNAGSPFGSGWSLLNVQRLWPVSGGVILEYGAGLSSWFANGQQAGTFVTPEEDTSTLVRNGDNSYTRTLKDGTRINFSSAGLQTSVVDRNGNTLAFGYNGSSQLTTVTDPYSLVTQLAYTNGRVTSITDPANRVTQLAYTGSGRLQTLTDPDSAAWNFGYDAQGRLTSLADPRNKTTQFAYNFAGRAQTVTRPDNTTEQYAAWQMSGLASPPSGTQGNPAGPVLVVQALANYTDPRNNVWQTRLDWSGRGRGIQAADPLADMTVIYREPCGCPWLVSDPLGRRTRTFHDDRDNPTKVVNADDSVQQYTYNGYSEPPLTQVEPTGATTAFAYDTAGNLTGVTQPDPDGPGPLTSPVWTYTYTARGLVATATDPLNHTTTNGYDARDRLTQVTYADTSHVLSGYDTASNLTSRTDERGYVTQWAYDPMGRPTQLTLPDSNTPPNNPVYTYQYDLSGNRTGVTDPLNHTTTTAYDNLNRPSSVTNALNQTTSYGYDAAGNLVTVTDALNRVTTYTVDAANRVTAVTNPMNQTMTFGLDKAGQVLTTTDALNRTTTYTYNVRGWLTSTTDSLSDVTQNAYNSAGDQTSVTQSGPGAQPTTSNYTFDNLHRQTVFQNQVGANFQRTYDALGNVLTETDPLGHTRTYTYEARNRLLSVSNALGQATQYGYDLAGNRTSVTDALNRVTQFSFDAQNRLVTQTSALNGVVRNGYDLAGRLTSVTDPVGNVTRYTYDNADRLTVTTDPNNNTTVRGLDAAGQLTSLTDRNGRQRTFGYDPAGRRTSEVWRDSLGNAVRTISYTFDAAGQLTGASGPDSAYAFQYDNAGRMTRADNQGTPGVPHVALQYGYNVFGLRATLSDGLGGLLSYSDDIQNIL
jgi:YD repeat-containing protein